MGYGPHESTSQTTSRSAQPFLHSSQVRPAHTHTHTQTQTQTQRYINHDTCAAVGLTYAPSAYDAVYTNTGK